MGISDLGLGLGLLLLVEGLPLFLSPARYRRWLMRIEEVPDGVLRGLGLAAMTCGIALLYVLRVAPAAP